jgi:hypothetical protein
MGILRMLSARSGDDQTTWDAAASEAGYVEARAAVQAAERIFAASQARGAIAIKVSAGKLPERIERFDATAEQIILIPRVVGG